uniref:Uncharacterized protein n=1 Tax=Cynoglossus semilaevis TaxID=244447 RepID=A0A3P8WT35_CYNSE
QNYFWTEQHLFVCILLAFCLTSSTNGGKVLVWYTEASHWINMKHVLETLVDRGHAVTVLMPSASLYMDKDSKFQYETFNMDRMGYSEILLKLSKIMKLNMDFVFKCLDGVVKSGPTMKSLKEKQFDVLLADPVFFGSELVSDILGIPLIYSLRFSHIKILERQCGQLPAPPSFVPAFTTRLTDKMDFLERVWNFVFYLGNDLAFNGVWREVDKYYSEVRGTPTSACEMVGQTDIWLIRNYWDFDFPHPILPNFKYVGGIHCRPANPLPEDIEEFVQSSGEHGVVVFSLGSFITNLTREKGNVIASALAQIPQKVVWGYKGEKPETLGVNTRLYKWIPQNDLLGNKNLKQITKTQGKEEHTISMTYVFHNII